MSFKPYTEKNQEEKNWNLFDFRSDPDPEPDPDPHQNDTDPKPSIGTLRF